MRKATLAATLNDVVVGLYGQPLVRGDHVYGASGAAFCLEAQVLQKRLRRPTPTNSRMFLGKMLHEAVFPQICERYFPKRWWQRRKWDFHRVLTYDYQGQFMVEAHPDLDYPAEDLIVEFKTTQSDLPFQRGEFLTEAYLMQANAYAAMAGRAHWEIWVMHLEFEELEGREVVSVLRGDVSAEEWQRYLERIWMVDRAVRDGQDLAGPEAPWECSHCQFLAEDCPIHLAMREKLVEHFPCEKKAIPEELINEFEVMRKLGKIRYDKSQKAWVYV